MGSASGDAGPGHGEGKADQGDPGDYEVDGDHKPHQNRVAPGLEEDDEPSQNQVDQAERLCREAR